MKNTAEIRELKNLMIRNAYDKAGISDVEMKRAHELASKLPESRRTKCWVCWERKDPALIGIGLCRGHVYYALATQK